MLSSKHVKYLKNIVLVLSRQHWLIHSLGHFDCLLDLLNLNPLSLAHAIKYHQQEVSVLIAQKPIL